MQLAPRKANFDATILFASRSPRRTSSWKSFHRQLGRQDVHHDDDERRRRRQHWRCGVTYPELSQGATDARTSGSLPNNAEPVKDYGKLLRIQPICETIMAAMLTTMQMFGEQNQAFVGLSNISRAGLNKLDFSGAVVGSGSGLPVHLHSDFFVSSSLKLRNVGPVFGQDASGNWWLSWVMRSEAWPRVEQQIARESGLRVL